MARPLAHPTLSPLTARPIRQVRGVGPERAAQLARLDIHTVADLLLHRPHRYEDRRAIQPIAKLPRDVAALSCGRIVALGTKRYGQGRKSIFEIILEDGSGRLHCRWWNLPFMENYFSPGDEVLAYGRLRSERPRTMDHPETEVIDGGEDRSIHLGRIAPIYPLTEGLPQRWLRSLVWRVLQEFPPADPAMLPHHPSPTDNPPSVFRSLHFPEHPGEEVNARRSLALEEFIHLQSSIAERRRRLRERAGKRRLTGDNRLIKPFLAALPFQLTESQTTVLREIRHDLASHSPMRRLLQGDVGSGKTAVAAAAALMALECGCSVVLMAPTEILAGQHHQVFQRWFEPLGIGVELRTGSRKSTPAPNTPRLVVGTHALIESGFHVNNLGLVIIDEQHRFGVAQREELLRKGACPHLLVTTATPIPRTLALTLYGDLDVSVIRQPPAGRGVVRTFVRPPEALPKVRDFIRARLRAGRQAYVVLPRVDEVDKPGMKAVTREFATLEREFHPFRVGLLHGRLPAAEKERVMDAFREQRVQLLLATSLIEVGVDVPNATIMLVENADLFGLAQLHQLRGRIGRGAHESHCILMASARTTPEGRARLAILENHSDGFAIAEADLKLRGPGDFLGQAQSGLPPLRFGDLTGDLDLMEQAREWVAARAANPPAPELSGPGPEPNP